VRCCSYGQAPRELGLTDHAAMTLTLAPVPATTDAAR